jgi:hypothetical protein
MSQPCEYCDADHDVSDTVFAIVSHGFGHANKEHKPFCSVECRVWWRRRCSDNPGAWEQPAPKGYQGRLSRFVTDDTDANESAPQPATIAASESTATVEADA